MDASKSSAGDWRRSEERGNGVEKRPHPAPTRRSTEAGSSCTCGTSLVSPAAAARPTVGAMGSPLTQHLSTGGGGSGGIRGSSSGSSIFLTVLDAEDPGCRAMVPYTASPIRRTPLRNRLALPAPPSLLALPASAEDIFSPSTSFSASTHISSQAVGGAGARGGIWRSRVDIPLEVFPVVFQYMDAPTLCSVSSVSREWRKQGNDDQYWRRLCRARFNVTPDAFAPPPDPIKRLYQLQHGSFKAVCRGCRHGFNTAAPPSISPHTSAQLLMGLMISNAM